jgi:DNA (cytosine-5)-methyltransferase 1
LVAVTRGLDFTFEDLAPTLVIVKKLKDALDDVPDDSPLWSRMEGLKAKQVRDAAKGSRFKMQLIDGESTSVPVLTKGLAKNRSTDPKIVNERDPSLLRSVSVSEHAKIKGVPYSLVEGMSTTQAHQLLGQGIVYEPFAAVGKRLGESIANYLKEVALAQEKAAVKPVNHVSSAGVRRRSAVG